MCAREAKYGVANFRANYMFTDIWVYGDRAAVVVGESEIQTNISFTFLFLAKP